jgi:hypothetical protein
VDERTLRTLIAAVQNGITRTTAPAAASADDKQALTRAWDSLLQHLALGPAPDVRPCPRCDREIMRAATACGYCWSKVSPAPPGGE